MATTKITSPDLFNLESLNSALKLPSGTTAQRPTSPSPSTGEWRYNTTTNYVEYYDGAEWRDLQSENIPPINSENFNTVLYTGDGGAARQVTGVGFKPDLVWVKKRNSADDNVWFDTTRGVQKEIISNSSAAEATKTEAISSFDVDGYTTGANGAINSDGSTYVAWNWKANGGTTSSNTDGTNTSTVQTNTSAGFSIVQGTASGGLNTVNSFGHGLGVKPSVIILKATTSTDNWYVYHTSLGAGQRIDLNDTGAASTSAEIWANTEPTTSVFSIKDGQTVSVGATFIAYCFASVAGYSSFGSYTGNNSTNGPIENTGFEPAFLMIKRTDSSSDWLMYDNKRSTSNPRDSIFRANTNQAELTSAVVNLDFLSNGFQLKTSTADLNASGGTYIYIAFGSDASAAPALADSFANKLYDGTGGTQAITGLGFSPSFVWLKRRDGTGNHYLNDTIRGTESQISSNLTAAETTFSSNITSYDTDGFTLGTSTDNNGSGQTFVAWNWKANPVPTINTDGTRQAIVSANAASGFSIMKYTGDGNTATIGHGLSSAPEIIFVKKLTGSSDWPVYASGLTSAAYRLVLSSTDAESTTNDEWNSTAPTSTVISVGSGGNVSDNGATFIAYCFASISGFSSIGTYDGSASAVSVDTGFKPSFVLVRNTGVEDWNIMDSARGGDERLFPNTNGAESTTTNACIFNSDGFTIGVTGNASLNNAGDKYIYMAFKENPLQVKIPSGKMGYLVTAGGGGSGADSGGGAGAGGGGLRTTYGLTSGGGASAETNLTLATGTYTITVGAGGAAYDGSTTAQNGVASTITGIASVSTVGGGAGGDFLKSGTAYKGNTGGSGGGSANSNGALTLAGGAGTANEGFAGGAGSTAGGPSSDSLAAGGGGGSAQVGTNGALNTGGNGGNGLNVAITGSNAGYAGGGGGGCRGTSGTTAGQGGNGGGGDAVSSGNGNPGTANTGGGAGGGRDNGAAGGSGIVVLRLNTTDYSGTTTGSPIVTTNSFETILTYTGSGTYVHS